MRQKTIMKHKYDSVHANMTKSRYQNYYRSWLRFIDKYVWGSLNSFCFHYPWLRLILPVHNFQMHKNFSISYLKTPKNDSQASGISWVQISAAALDSSVLWKPLVCKIWLLTTWKPFIQPNLLNEVLLVNGSSPHTFNFSYLLLLCFWRRKTVC